MSSMLFFVTCFHSVNVLLRSEPIDDILVLFFNKELLWDNGSRTGLAWLVLHKYISIAGG